MKKKIKNVLILASSMLLMASCGTENNNSSEASSNESSQSSVITKLSVDKIEDISVGDEIDIADYVKAPSNKSWDYEILDDGYNSDILETISSEAPTLSTTTTLRAIKAGDVTFKVTSGDEIAIGHFKVNKSEAWNKLDAYVKANKGENFTVSTTKKINSDGTQSNISEKNTFYRTENYVFSAGDYNGVAFNEKTNMGYYYTMNGVEDKYSFSFTPSVVGETYGKTVTRASYKIDYPLFSAIFNDGYIQYNAKAAQYFGKEYALVIPYTSSDKTPYNYFNMCFSSIGYEIINGYICFPSYYCPIINANGELEVYIVYSRSFGTINSNSVLAGPYKFGNVGTTSIGTLETFYKGEAPVAIASNTALLNNVTSINNYTAKVNTYFEDLAGEKIETPKYFANTLPTASVDYAINDTGIKSTKFSLIDKSSEYESVILKNGTYENAASVVEYVEGENSKYTLNGTYSTGKWQNNSLLSLLAPSGTFSKAYWTYGKLIPSGDNKYKVVSINDDLGYTAIKQMVCALGLLNLINDTTNPFYLYGEDYSYMTLDIGANTSADKSGEIVTKVADGDGKFYEYHIEFAMTKINSTIIEEPAVSD